MYKPRYQSHFFWEKDIKNFKKKHDNKSISIIKNAIENELVHLPYENSESLTHH